VRRVTDRGIAGTLRKPIVRSARIWIALAVVVLAVVAIVTAVMPLAVSSEAVRVRLEQQLAALTGHRVTLGQSTELRFWPMPQLSMSGITISSRRHLDARPILEADLITAQFNLVSALTGRPRFNDILLVRPTFALERYAGSRTSWMSDRGEIAEETAKVADAQAASTASSANQIPLGMLRIESGTLVVDNQPLGHVETLTALNGIVSWPSMAAPARAEFAGVLRGEPIHVTASSSRPVDLLAGAVAPFDMTFGSTLLNLTYRGSASFDRQVGLEGDLELESPSVRRALLWSGTEIKPGQAIGALEVEAHLSGSGRQLRFDDLILGIDDNRGVGALDLAWPEDGRPSLAGTLAFDTLDVAAFLTAFTPLPTEGDEIAATIDTGFLRQIGLDLRLSAQTARIGRVSMENMAAAARVEEGRALFDIGDASAFGGNVSGRVAISEDGFSGGGEIHLSAQAVDFGAIYDTLEIKGPLPRGIGMINLTLRSPNPVWATSIDNLQGTMELAVDNGLLPGFNPARFRELAGSQRFFSISQASDGEMPFQAGSFRCRVRKRHGGKSRGATSPRAIRCCN
jgi:AsmA protein